MKKLMTHLYYGDPNEAFSQKLATALIEVGADILEIGIPYTDPVCDGEVFQRACQRALAAGITPYKVLEGIKKIKDKRYGDKRNNIPIYLTSYYGPIFKMGEEKFVVLAKEAGANGLIVPDLLLEEQGVLRRACDKYNLSLIQFVTVYSDKKRLKEIVKASTDFIYCILLPGITGDSYRLALGRVEGLLKLLRSMTDKEILVGFGIKSREDVKEILEMGADGVIVGSAIAKLYERTIEEPSKRLTDISAFIKSLKAATMEGDHYD